jgi:uncharacterized protein (DUF488 family)
MSEREIWTIGHSTHAIDEFIGMLNYHGINIVADIRRFPGSRRLPHFNRETLERSLHENRIQYKHFEDLGGRRNPRPDSKNSGWRVLAFRGYADYMESQTFHDAITSLESLAVTAPLAYMCSEAVWWSCHRALVSDYLKHHGWTVRHIMSKTKADLHPWTKPARIENGKLTYAPQAILDL